MRAVLYLEKGSFDFYAEKMTRIPKLVFPAGTIQDIEVLDVVKLDQAIKTFIDTNKLLPGNVTIVLSPTVTFMKDIVTQDPKKTPVNDPKHPQAPALPVEQKKSQQEQIDEFLEYVPFNEVSSITLPIQNGVKVIAANKELFDDIKRSFEKYGFTTDAVAPLVSFGAVAVDQMIAKKLLEKADIAKQHNMVTARTAVQTKTEEKESDEPSASKKTDKEKPNNTRLFAMIGAFAILMLVLGVMVYQNFIAPAPPKKTVSSNAAPVTTRVSPTPTISPTPSIGKDAFASLTAQIVEPTTAGSESASIEDALHALGISEVTVKKGKTVPSKTVVAYSKTLDTAVKEKINQTLQPILPNALFTQADGQTADVVVTLGTE